MSQSNRTLLTNELLRGKISIFKKIISCLEEIAEQPEKGGESATSICLKYGVNFLSLRKLINFKEIDKVCVDKVDHHDICIEENPFERLYRCIFYLSEDDAIEFPVDLVESIEYCMEKHLTGNESKVISNRFGLYEYSKTLEEMQDIIGVKRERVRQIEAKALRKLRHHESADIIRDGLIEYNSKQEIRRSCMDRKINEASKLIAELNDEQLIRDKNKVTEGKCTNVDISGLELSLENKKKVINLVYNLCKDEYLKYIPMSIRLRNCLSRSRFISMDTSTIFDLFMLDDDVLSSIRNFGVGSLNELNTICNSFLSIDGVDRYSFKTMFDQVYKTYWNFIKSEYIPDLISKAKEDGLIGLSVIDSVAEKVYLKEYGNYTFIKELEKYDIYNKDMFFLINRSPIYYQYTRRYNTNMINRICKLCDEFLSNFDMTYELYLERKMISRTTDNNEDFNLKWADINSMVIYAMDKVITYADILLINKTTDVSYYIDKIMASIYRWASPVTSPWFVENEWDEPKVKFDNVEVDPLTLYILISDNLPKYGIRIE